MKLDATRKTVVIIIAVLCLLSTTTVILRNRIVKEDKSERNIANELNKLPKKTYQRTNANKSKTDIKKQRPGK